MKCYSVRLSWGTSVGIYQVVTGEEREAVPTAVCRAFGPNAMLSQWGEVHTYDNDATRLEAVGVRIKMLTAD